MSPSVEDFRARAQVAQSAGRAAEAAGIFGDAVAAHPADAALWNSAGGASLRAGNVEEAVTRYERACELAPALLEFTINYAIALGHAGRHRAAMEALRMAEDRGASDVRYCSTRANACRSAGELAEAARWYDKALAIDRTHPRSAHGRARVALERGEPDAVMRFERALSCTAGDAELWLGKAQALEVAGKTEEAATIAHSLVDQMPRWPDAMRFLAQLNLAKGSADFAAPYRAAARLAPDDPAIPAAHCAALASLDRSAEATEVAANARLTFPHDEQFALLEANHASESGQTDRAEAIWSNLALQTVERALHEARHRLRLGKPERANSLLDRVLEHEPFNVTGWALRGVTWRLLDDPRLSWLHEQPGLVQFLPLDADAELVPQATEALNLLHDCSSFPLGQSLRGGTQTRGGLFDRHEPVWQELRSAIERTLECYRSALAPGDSRHPVLRHRDSPWRITGSWSVRLGGGGDHHTSHIHPRGTLSSALYLELPAGIEEGEEAGWLELGRPPVDLGPHLPPLRTIRPRAGHLALFPSTLFHGTTPFRQGRRLTVAFDVAPQNGR